ncbi:amidohydrolase family protein [Streptomyces sp. CB03238]|uniref:amidohydrolase family protein n=1 Tax=Streptomyces sp. CB03238 TaxID=1907777 RepID=UPI0019D4D7AD|nr:amidohydrolase family protein [Streptomyces sp. CB03238]
MDIHTHAMPLPLLRWLGDRSLAALDGLDEAHVVRIDPRISGVAKDAPLPCPPAQVEVGARLALMDRTGVGCHAVALPPFLMGSGLTDPVLLRELIRRGNDALAGYAAGAPDRLCALGTVPVGDPSAAEEARRCLDDLGMAGVAIGSQGLGRELDDPVNEELWAFLARRQAFTFLHPSVPVEPERTRAYWMAQLVGFPMETALAVSRLVLGGVLERHRFPLCLAHGGGCLPALAGRLDLGWARKPPARASSSPPSTWLRGLYYDTAVFSREQLARLVADVGAEHVLLGTDTPFDLADEDPVRTVRELGLDERESELILGGNARRLLAHAFLSPGSSRRQEPGVAS